MKRYVCVYLVESPHGGDSTEYTQHIIILYKNDKTSLNYPICLLTWRYDHPSVARNTHI